MAKATSRFVCQSCGEAFLRWEGQCRTCGEWNSLVETVVRETPKTARVTRGPGPGPVAESIALAAIGEHDVPRLPTGIGELDRVLGGGIVPGSLILLGGEPGIGKSTLLLQVAAGIGAPVLYATGEESAAQVRLRAGRLDLLAGAPGQSIAVLAEHDVERIIEVARSARPALVVVDSIQTATVDELDGAAGSVGQVRESAVRLMEFAEGEGIAVVLVGHVTKDGSIAGPKTLEHLVDAVIAIEGERYAALRLVRAAKNRFGSTEEVGVFEMAGTGLLEVSDPARAFLAEHAEPAPGSVVAPTLEGSRPLLVEVQALVAAAGYGTPARKASGIDPNRLGLLVAVLGKRAGVGLAVARRLRQPRGRLVRGRAGPGPAGRPGPRVEPAGAPRRARDRGHRRGRTARRAALGQRPGTAAARGRAPGLRDRDRASTDARQRRAARARAAHRGGRHVA